jgi:hypothetical protein
MNQMDQHQLGGRLAELEHAIRTGVYARLYGAIAVLALALSFMPLFEDVVDGDLRTTYGSLWQMAGRPGGGPAVLGVLLLLGLIALLVVGTVGVRSAMLPIAVAVDALLIVLMLITRPGAGTPKPDLTGAGTAALVIALCAVAVSVAHAIHLRR